jgi:hypothetical protein
MSGQDNGTGASGPNPQPGCFSLRAQSRYHRPAATPPPRRRRIPSSVGGKGQSHKQTQWKTRGAGKSDTYVRAVHAVLERALAPRTAPRYSCRL